MDTFVISTRQKAKKEAAHKRNNKEGQSRNHFDQRHNNLEKQTTPEYQEEDR